ncbi:unnamed protein product [Periconia digitata]|uniref:AAA+ ATPase domain-containing protein n=1 Tax=Periconia digitata TaxID=1303443 RepID=A0A9W4UKY6_9PLEO|nr:unnamed protein product [Periconia digitata]
MRDTINDTVQSGDKPLIEIQTTVNDPAFAHVALRPENKDIGSKDVVGEPSEKRRDLTSQIIENVHKKNDRSPPGSSIMTKQRKAHVPILGDHGTATEESSITTPYTTTYMYPPQTHWNPTPPGHPPGVPPHTPNPQMNTRPELDQEEELGGRCEVRTLYQQPVASCRCCFTWTHELPTSVKLFRDAEIKIKSGKTKRSDETFAILDRQSVHGNSLLPISVEINSARLKELLTAVFEGYPAIDLRQSRPKFAYPFTPFVHKWNALNEFKQNTENERDGNLIGLLIDTLKDKISTILDSMKEYHETGYIAWSDLLFTFTPGEIVVRKHKNTYAAGRLCRVKNDSNTGMDRYSLEVEVVDWDGKTTGFNRTKWIVPSYEDTQLLRSMDIFPMAALSGEDQDRVESLLIERGKKFETLRGMHHSHFCGEFQTSRPLNRYGMMPHEISGSMSSFMDGRIMIDAHAYYLFQGSSSINLKPLYAANQGDTSSDYLHDPEIDYAVEMPSHRPLPPPPRMPEQPDPYQAANTRRYQPKFDSRPLTDEQRMLTVPYVKGFSLLKKTWGLFEVDNIRPVSWSASAFDNLVLDAEEKELLLALIDVKEDSDTTSDIVQFDDFIDGKGQGIILLLSGPPGVGKTLTAESISEHIKLPLYRMGAGEIGQVASVVSNTLQTVLDLCARWNAVLLLDEADVFLEQRSNDQLQRNELVSVFLTLLEYYRGVLILTTNRPTNLDSAFESRIDILLNYKALDQDARETVWKNFLQTLPGDKVNVSSEEVKKLAVRELNGRQIKSAVKTARILAAREKKPLGMRHLEVVLSVRERGVGTLCGGGVESE